MHIRVIFFIVLFFSISCQSKKNNTSEGSGKVSERLENLNSKNDENGRWKCEEEVCLHLRNHDKSKRTFEIFMINSVPIFGFQCDLPGVNIINSSGGLLEENEYQTSNSASRLLSFSMQAKPIPAGMGVLTEVHYDKPLEEVCMTQIIFAGIGGSKLSNNNPDCMGLD
tara:strand:- start:28 stop:531 length:504 start_codon:yes stop_codon:yes gene_type:complete